MTQRGFYDATTDEKQIDNWWDAVPNANIGIPTGPETGILVIDVDRDRYGFGSLEDLEARFGKLPDTATTRTGGGGMHFLFRYPRGKHIKSKADAFGLQGVDVKATGGYVVGAPSYTETTYKFEERRPLAELPPEWLEALRAPPENCRKQPRLSASRPALLAPDAPIPEGQRNNTLASIGGRLRAQGYSQEAINEELQRINQLRCAPPLPDTEVETIARSVSRYEPGDASSGASPETREALKAIEVELCRREWRSMGGKSERDIVVALIKLARQYGTMIPAGIRVQVSIRALALAAALSRRATENAVRRLKEHGILRGDNEKRTGTNAGALVLLHPRAKVGHSTSGGGVREGENTSVLPLRAPRLRWSAPEVKRLGKTCGAVLDILEAAGGTASVEELAEALHVKRLRDLRRRIIARLEDAGVVECFGDTVSLVGDWLEALDRERECGGEIEAYRRDMDRYNREREIHRVKLLAGRGSSVERIEVWVAIPVERVRQILRLPDRAPTEKEMAAARRSRSDGLVSELHLVAPEGVEPPSEPCGPPVQGTAWRLWVDEDKERFYFPERYSEVGAA